MGEKTLRSEKNLTKFDASLVSKKCDNQKDVKATDSNPHYSRFYNYLDIQHRFG